MTLVAAILDTLLELRELGMSTDLRDAYLETREGFLEFAQAVADKLPSAIDEQEAA